MGRIAPAVNSHRPYGPATRGQRKIAFGMTSTAASSGSETSSEKPSLRTVDLPGPAGRLEALLNEGASDAPFVGACLPSASHRRRHHAQQGRLSRHEGPECARSGASAGLCCASTFAAPALSEGQHDGRAESADVSRRARLASSRIQAARSSSLGFSFGAAMAIAASCGTDSRHNPTTTQVFARLVALGLPTQGFGHTYRYPAALATALCPSSSSAAIGDSVRLRSRTCAGGRLRRRSQKPGAPPRRRSLLYRSPGYDADGRSQAG